MVVELAVPIKEGRRSSRTRMSTRLLLSRILLDPQLRVGTLDEVRQLRDRVYAIEIAIGLGPAGQAADQAGKPGVLEVLRRDLDALGRETHKRHGCVDRRVPASALKELRRGLDTLSHEVHGRMPSYEPQGYSYHSAYGRTQRIMIPLKTPHVERRVNGIRRAMSGQDRKGSNDAVLQLVALYGANQVYRQILSI
ncbi:Hypothetical protein PHPALM_3370 [Phytophthora palmivora]|uniref:Uncharacterized protein n=1 Tax=Phytophthora palmivora TaxID=4796 RepID=A0A2P4YMJ0_9STRA|nr:Hypothetical protein PHPALM_3370 [Phytophthora palmivora]